MIIYISESLDSKKNGGSSTSGFEFLQMLRIIYKQITVLSYDSLDNINQSGTFYGNKLFKIHNCVQMKRRYSLKPFTPKRILKYLYYYIISLNKTNIFRFKEYSSTERSQNILYVNSWSGIFLDHNIVDMDDFKKICIVRGSPESFEWQSYEQDKRLAKIKAAEYLDLFDELIFVSLNGMTSWKQYMQRDIKSYYLPNSINEEDIARYYDGTYVIKNILSNFNSTAYNIVVVGSIQRRKHQDIFLEIMIRLVKEIPNVHIHFVGVISDTWGGDKIFDKYSKSQYNNYVTFHGHSDQVLQYVKLSDVAVFTSHAEAFPRTVAEYMAMEKPIIASDVSGVNEMIQHQVNGLLYNPQNPQELLSCINVMFNDPKKAREYGIAARKTYFSKFCKSKQIFSATKIFSEI